MPSIPELDPLPEGTPATHYVGSLTRTDPRSAAPPDWFAELHPERPLVYVTIGGGADPVGGARLFQVLYEALGDLPLQVVASTPIGPRVPSMMKGNPCGVLVPLSTNGAHAVVY